ncbi:hypothetical protein L195_g064691, partial [Trifolium pratense]
SKSFSTSDIPIQEQVGHFGEAGSGSEEAAAAKEAEDSRRTPMMSRK